MDLYISAQSSQIHNGHMVLWILRYCLDPKYNAVLDPAIAFEIQSLCIEKWTVKMVDIRCWTVSRKHLDVSCFVLFLGV